MDLKAVIPANATARISVPTDGLDNVRAEEGGRVVWEIGSFIPGTPGVEGAANEEAYVTFTVGSGVYVFTLKGERR